MSDTAVHLVASVLPDVAVRHWVCSFPWGVRAVLGYDKELCRAATHAFAKDATRVVCVQLRYRSPGAGALVERRLGAARFRGRYDARAVAAEAAC